jgi:hypothetical protein
MLKQFNPHQSIRIALHQFETSVALLRTDSMAAIADSSALVALIVILSMTSLRHLSRCKGLSIARKIQGSNNVRSIKLIFNALINSPQHSTIHASYPKFSTIATAVFLSTVGMACHSDGSKVYSSICLLCVMKLKESAACMNGSNFLHHSANVICLTG